jgi:hypothetical protein
VTELRAAFGTREQCTAILGSSLAMNFGVSDLSVAIEDGRVVFAADQVAACLEATARCGHVANTQPADVACRRVFQGTRDPGESCARDEECAGGGRCVISDACPGTCAPRVAIGEDCVSSPDCDDTAGPVACDDDTSTCVAVDLLPPVGEGEECWKFSTEEAGPQRCAEGLWCDGDGIFPPEEYRRGTCRRTLIPVGDPCADDEDLCADGAACWGDVCTVLEFRREPGAPCGGAAGCDPFERLECVNARCESIGDGLEGSPCRFHDWSAHVACEPGFACVVTGTGDPVTSATPRTCQSPRATGEPCAFSHECLSQTCGSDGFCAASFCGNARAQF